MATASTLLGSLFGKISGADDPGSHRRVLVDCRPNSNLDSLIRSIVLGLDPEPDATLVRESGTSYTQQNVLT